MEIVVRMIVDSISLQKSKHALQYRQGVRSCNYPTFAM